MQYLLATCIVHVIETVECADVCLCRRIRFVSLASTFITNRYSKVYQVPFQCEIRTKGKTVRMRDLWVLGAISRSGGGSDSLQSEEAV